MDGVVVYFDGFNAHLFSGGVLVVALALLGDADATELILLAF